MNKPNIKRETFDSTMSKRFVWAIAYGSSIGWGAFILPGDWLKSSGTLGAVLGIIIGGLLMLMIAVGYGALTAKFPVSGGEFAFTYVGFGKYFSFISSWFLIFGYICVVAVNASAFSLLFKFILPDFLEVGYLYTIAGWDVYITEVILSTFILIVFAIISFKGAGLSGKLQFYFCLFMAIVVAGLFTLSFTPSTFSFSNAVPLFNEDVGVLKSIIVIVAIAPWMYVGFDNIPQAAEEFNFDANQTFKLIVFGIIASIITYVLMILLTSWTFPYTNMLEKSELWLTGDVIQSAFGKIGLFVLALSISFGVFTGLNGFYLSSSRLLFALGRAKFIPGAFSKLHRKTNTPLNAIIFVMAVCLAAPWLGRTALSWIVDMSSVGVSIAFLATSLVTIKFFSDKRHQHTLYTVFGIIGAIISVVFLALLLIPGSPAALTLPSYIALGVWTIIGLVFFMFQFGKLKQLKREELDHLILDMTREEIHSKDI